MARVSGARARREAPALRFLLFYLLFWIAARLLAHWQPRSEEHTSELQSLMRISYAVFCLKKKRNKAKIHTKNTKQLTKEKTTNITDHYTTKKKQTLEKTAPTV